MSAQYSIMSTRTKLESIILEYPSAPWNWNALSANPAVSFEFILANPTFPWSKRYVSQNKNITEQTVLENTEYGWDLERLCGNPNMSLGFFLKYIINPIEVQKVDWHLLSCNPSIRLFDIIQNPQYPWSDRYLSANPNITSNYVLSEGCDRNWFVPLLCANEGITANDIFKNTLHPLLNKYGGWDYRNLSANPNLPIAYVKKHLDKSWNYHTISINASITDIVTYRELPWDGHGLSMNSNITFDFVQANANIAWDASALLSNSAIVEKHITDNLDWFQKRSKDPIAKYMSSNPTITSRWIKKNKLHIDWTAMSMTAMF